MLNDRYIIPVFIAGTILFVLFAFFLIAYLLVQKQKQNAYHFEKQKMIYDNEMKLMNARIEEQERAMEQISKEIHDDVGQALSLIKLNTHIFTSAEGIANNKDYAVLAADTKELLVKTISTIRNISHSLNSDYIKVRGLADVLKKELEYVSTAKNIVTGLHIEGIYKTLFPEKELLIYRIAQEAINNVIKHSDATGLDITLTYNPDTFVMHISDNGVGFEQNNSTSMNGIGFLNMFQRAEIMNGSLDVVSQPAKGCNVILTLQV